MSDRWLNLRFGPWHLTGKHGKQWWRIYRDFNVYHRYEPLWNIRLYELRVPWRRR